MTIVLAAAVAALGATGQPVEIGKANVDLIDDRRVVRLQLATASSGGNTWDLYLNRDGGHSVLNVRDFPGITSVRYSKELTDVKTDPGFPNMFFPYPVFGNCSRAYIQGVNWRSLPRALVTFESRRIRDLVRMYVSNQIWVFPANEDTPPIGKHGDVFASVTPYWFATVGRSYSDLPYLKATLEASRAFDPDVKKEIVRRGLLAPTIQSLVRHSLKNVKTEDDYLTERAHPTAFPDGGVDVRRLVMATVAIKLETIPPIAALSVVQPELKCESKIPELTYSTAFAWAFVLRSPIEKRVFYLSARGAKEYRFFQTHGDPTGVKIEKILDDSYKVTIETAAVNSTNRVDIAVVGRNPGTMWGAPSYLSIARMNAATPGAYVDPVLNLK